MTKQTAIKEPPDKCPFCFQERVGIQEGQVIFKCQTYLQYLDESSYQTRQSSECQKKINLAG